MIKEAIVKIVGKEDLTYNEAYDVINEIMSGETSATQNAITRYTLKLYISICRLFSFLSVVL